VAGLLVGLLVGLPAAPSLNLGGLTALGLIVLGVILVLDDNKLVLLFVVARLFLIVSVVAEGRQRPPHNLGTRESLKCGPCFVVRHAPLKSEGQLCRYCNVVIRAHPSAMAASSPAMP
jgi:hypothetical protein